MCFGIPVNNIPFVCTLYIMCKQRGCYLPVFQGVSLSHAQLHTSTIRSPPSLYNARDITLRFQIGWKPGTSCFVGRLIGSHPLRGGCCGKFEKGRRFYRIYGEYRREFRCPSRPCTGDILSQNEELPLKTYCFSLLRKISRTETIPLTDRKYSQWLTNTILVGEVILRHNQTDGVFHRETPFN